MRKLAKLWEGLTAVFAALLTLVLIGTSIANSYVGTINDALNVQTSIVIPNPDAENIDTQYYKTSFGDGQFNEENLKLLDEFVKQQNEDEMREGAALLYNENGALPLAANAKVSLFGLAAAHPVWQGASAGTRIGTGGETAKVELIPALEAEGFSVNMDIYNALAAQPTAGEDNGSNGARSSVATGAGEFGGEFYSELMADVGEYTDAAIVVLSRIGAEGTDLDMTDTDDDGDTISALALHSNEREMLRIVSEKFGKDNVIVLLNTGCPMEVYEIEDYAGAVMYLGTPGHYGFTGVAEILSGKTNPSGHLVDTFATNSLSSPAAVNSGSETPYYSNADEIVAEIGEAQNATRVSFQAENIYIGYRYYETRYADTVIGRGDADNAKGASFGAASWKYENEVSYPFGFGLSYTEFEQTLGEVKVGKDEITVTASVKNVGDAAGKSVVQVYAQTPYGEYEVENKVEKSAIQLAGFAKTKLLAPGESDTVTVTIDPYLFAAYDANGAEGYILSEGTYYISVGDDAHDALNNILAAQGYTTADGMTENGDEDKVYSYEQGFDAEKYMMSETGVRVTNQFEDIDLNYWVENAGTYLTRSDWNTFPTAQTTVEATDEMIQMLSGNYYTTPEDAPSFDEVASQFGVNSNLSLASMRGVPITDRDSWEKFIFQLKVEDIVLGTVEGLTNPAIEPLSPSFVTGDGCDSVQGTVYIYEKSGTNRPHTDASGANDDTAKITRPNNRYTSKPILTGTYNADLYAGRGKAMGEEGLWSLSMENFGTGVNLHRTPFGGRNYEYMSECPTISYLASIPEVEAMEKTGSHAAPKHCVGNDQETQRMGVSVFGTEQAFREGALRAAEGALRVAKAGGLMQSYERVGMVFSSSNKTLNTTVFRSEWGWTGNIVTDACPFNSGLGSKYDYHTLEMLDAGSQQFCLDSFSPRGTHGELALAWAKEHDDGYILEKLIDATISWEYAICNSVVVNGMAPGDMIVQVTPWWQTALLAINISLGTITAACAVLLVVSKVKKAK